MDQSKTRSKDFKTRSKDARLNIKGSKSNLQCHWHINESEKQLKSKP